MKLNPEEILSKVDHNSGMTVPDGYFADFNRKMAAELPPIEFEMGTSSKVAPRSIWQRVRPYIYMAAMFAGVWCMMKMFDIARPTTDLSIETHPVVASAVNNDEFFRNYIVPAVDESELYDELYDEGFDTTQFGDY